MTKEQLWEVLANSEGYDIKMTSSLIKSGKPCLKLNLSTLFHWERIGFPYIALKCNRDN